LRTPARVPRRYGAEIASRARRGSDPRRPGGAQQTARVTNLPAVSGDVDEKAAAERAQNRAGELATREALQGQNPYTHSPTTPVFRPTFVGSGANSQLIMPGANSQLIMPGATAPISIAPPPPAATPPPRAATPPPPAATPPPPTCVPGANRTC
jgi:hypothetical protein